ncbi:hypothetical protein PoB_005906300 [Plakobranchus ocellatus]|uniref:Uncharacterized protein n=1 Tax=Plakobranchus ocellatus TaxID=259542 RepID=A0AAV4CKL5_9GAST|nr:hypothetical protein PoB_005906300 [Plakobranchus ocellatus]
MRTHVIYVALLCSHIQFCLALLVGVPPSAADAIEVGPVFEGPAQTLQDEGGQQLSKISDGETDSSDKSVGALFRYALPRDNVKYTSGVVDSKLSTAALRHTKVRKGVELVKGPRVVARKNSLVDRMPISFGKRRRINASDPAKTYGQEEATANIDDLTSTDDCRAGGQGVNCLDLLDVLYPDQNGLRRSSQYKSLEGDGKTMFVRIARDRLGRMPLTFGKRSAEAGRLSSETPLKDLNKFLKIDVRDTMLERMPNFYGRKKKNQTPYRISNISPPGDKDILTNSLSDPDVALLRPEDAVDGEKAEGAETSIDYTIPRKRPSRMDRMPLTFGKRRNAKGSDAQDFNHHHLRQYSRIVLQESALSSLGRRLKLDSDNDTGGSETAKGKDSSDIASFLCKIIDDMEPHARPGILKLLAPRHALAENEIDETAGVSDVSAAIGLPRKSTQGSTQGLNGAMEKREEMPPLYEKRGTNTRQRRGTGDTVYLVFPTSLLLYLEDQKNKLPPDAYKRLQMHTESMIKKYFVVNTPLLRSSRSRLGRMPLTFGKRGNNRTGYYKNIPAHSFSTRRVQPRSRMDRMPLSFGKRSTGVKSLCLANRISRNRRDKRNAVVSQFKDLFQKSSLSDTGRSPQKVQISNEENGASKNGHSPDEEEKEEEREEEEEKEEEDGIRRERRRGKGREDDEKEEKKERGREGGGRGKRKEEGRGGGKGGGGGRRRRGGGGGGGGVERLVCR